MLIAYPTQEFTTGETVLIYEGRIFPQRRLLYVMDLNFHRGLKIIYAKVTGPIHINTNVEYVLDGRTQKINTRCFIPIGELKHNTAPTLRMSAVDFKLIQDAQLRDVFEQFNEEKGKTMANPTIENVVYSGPVTTVRWSDKTLTVVRCAEGDDFDGEKALLIAYFRKITGKSKHQASKFLKETTLKAEQNEIKVLVKKERKRVEKARKAAEAAEQEGL